VESPFIEIGMAATLVYFLFLLFFLPLLGLLEKIMIEFKSDDLEQVISSEKN